MNWSDSKGKPINSGQRKTVLNVKQLFPKQLPTRKYFAYSKKGQVKQPVKGNDLYTDSGRKKERES